MCPIRKAVISLLKFRLEEPSSTRILAQRRLTPEQRFCNAIYSCTLRPRGHAAWLAMTSLDDGPLELSIESATCCRSANGDFGGMIIRQRRVKESGWARCPVQDPDRTSWYFSFS